MDLIRTATVAASLLACSAPASAEVIRASDTGFVSETRLIVAAPPAKLWRLLVRPDRWWDSPHTYSGDSRNLSLDLRPGGCWCEKTASGGVEHMRVIYVARGEMLRLAGGLGPLQAMPVNAVLTVTLKPAPGGTEATFAYAVAGAGLSGLAGPVDTVLAAQWARLKAAAER